MNSDRAISDGDRKAFHRDGAVILRNVLEGDWLATLEKGLDECANQPDGMSSELIMGETQIRVDQFPASRSSYLQEFILKSPVGPLVAEMLGTQVRFYMDQMFVKPAGELMATAWHQDTSYYNAEGRDLIRAWISPDPVPRGASLEVVCGSHNWNVTYRPLVGKDPNVREEEHKANLERAREYGFYANVNPEVDHPRWSQARERRIGSDGGTGLSSLFATAQQPTEMFNGYGEHVAHLYESLNLRQNY